MDPITIFLVGASIFAVTVAAWPWLCDFFQTRVIPFLRERFSPGVADAIADLIVTLDARTTPIRAQFVKGIQALRESVLGMKTTYTKTSAQTATATTEQYLCDQGKITRLVHEEQVNWSDIPEDIRRVMIKQQATSGTLDQLAIVERRINDVATEHGLLELIPNA